MDVERVRGDEMLAEAAAGHERRGRLHADARVVYELRNALRKRRRVLQIRAHVGKKAQSLFALENQNDG